MSKQPKKSPVRQPATPVADSKRVRFGNGMSPARIVRSDDPATRDSRMVRFGNGMIAPSLRK